MGLLGLALQCLQWSRWKEKRKVDKLAGWTKRLRFGLLLDFWLRTCRGLKVARRCGRRSRFVDVLVSFEDFLAAAEALTRIRLHGCTL